MILPLPFKNKIKNKENDERPYEICGRFSFIGNYYFVNHSHPQVALSHNLLMLKILYTENL